MTAERCLPTRIDLASRQRSIRRRGVSPATCNPSRRPIYGQTSLPGGIYNGSSRLRIFLKHPCGQHSIGVIDMKKLLIPAFFILTLATGVAQTPLGFQSGDVVRTVLTRQVGQKVELRLKSGEKIGGKLESVGDRLIHLTSVTGMEFFEAAVVLDDVSAILVRAAAK
jgi:hypothetical protein